MAEELSRRGFLELGVFSMASTVQTAFPLTQGTNPAEIGRVASSWIDLYREPSFRSAQLARFERDRLLCLLRREFSDQGPFNNPLWFETPDGYAHSGNLQIVRWQPQSPIMHLPETGALFEVSVPFTRTRRFPDPASDPLYRLYYHSTAWAEGVERGADGRLWYRLLDDMLRVNYYARAEHLRLIPQTELAPISPEVPIQAKRIQVHLDWQELRAFENDRLVMRARISSGIPDKHPQKNGVPTITPKGRFPIDRKVPYRHMGNGELTPDLEAYELPGVPWCMFFHPTGVALHGTYWHTDFGRPRSHGCVNMRSEDAKWLYRWTLPSVPLDKLGGSGKGTLVVVV